MHALLQAQPCHLPPRFQACNMEQVSHDSKWCQLALHASFSFASPISALDAQGSFVALGSDPAKHFKHALPLGSVAACSLMLCWTVASDASVQNVVVPSWRWGCPANAVCMLFSTIDNINGLKKIIFDVLVMIPKCLRIQFTEVLLIFIESKNHRSIQFTDVCF